MDTDVAGCPWRPSGDGLAVAVRLTPRGGRDRLEGVVAVDGRAMLKARVAAAPVDGGANRALVRLLAKAAGIAPSAVDIAAGTTARVKQVRLSGDPEALAARLSAHVGA